MYDLAECPLLRRRVGVYDIEACVCIQVSIDVLMGHCFNGDNRIAQLLQPRRNYGGDSPVLRGW
jgi:hypothetical protein